MSIAIKIYHLKGEKTIMSDTKMKMILGTVIFWMWTIFYFVNINYLAKNLPDTGFLELPIFYVF